MFRDQDLFSASDDLSLAETLEERSALLCRHLDEFAPHALLIEFFPFSRWKLSEEYLNAIAIVKKRRPSVVVACSLRAVPRTLLPDFGDRRYVGLQELEQWARDPNAELARNHDSPFYRQVVPVLNRDFDAVLIHSDPRFSRLESHYPWVDAIDIPVLYTGFVARQHPPTTVRGSRTAVLSCGGSHNDALLSRAVEAWTKVRSRCSGANLVGFAGSFCSEAELEQLDRLNRLPGVEVRRFSSTYAQALADAGLSISRAGYNTCADLLRLRVPALLIPHRDRGDQVWQARRMEELGLAQVLTDEDLSVDRLADAIEDGFATPRPEHDLDLEGGEGTRAWLEELVAAKSR